VPTSNTGELHWSNAIVYNTGQVIWSRPGLVTGRCNFDLTNFPRDEQRCEWKFGEDGSRKSTIIQLNSINMNIMSKL
jgi:hypothetical protein